MASTAEESIYNTKSEFEKSFKESNFYNKQTQDQTHLDKIIACLNIKSGMKILDLGTGTGYLAFQIANTYPENEIIGLDIVEQTLENNRKKALEKQKDKLKFASYDGLKFPFVDETFDVIVTRYALHHFPKIENTFKEIARVLKPSGIFFLADPAPNDEDKDGFVDAYMQMKKDGHIKFYTKEEWQKIGLEAGLALREGFETSIRFPRKRETAFELEDILKCYDEQIIKGYELEYIGDEIYITEKVNNLSFTKTI